MLIYVLKNFQYDGSIKTLEHLLLSANKKFLKNNFDK